MAEKQKVVVTCPTCMTECHLSEETIKQVLKRELLANEDSSFDAPARDLLYALLDGGGAKKLAKELHAMASQEIKSPQANQVKLRALTIIAGLMKHMENLNPPREEYSMMEQRQLEELLERKLGLMPTAAPVSTAKEPEWLTAARAKQKLRQQTEPLKPEDVVKALDKKYGGLDWYVRSMIVDHGAGGIWVFVRNLADVDMELLSGEPKIGGFKINVRKIGPDDLTSQNENGQDSAKS